jgi:perosamine synthetase
MKDTFKEFVKYIRDLYDNPQGVIPLHAPIFFGNEKKYMQECIDSTFVSSVGKFVDEFELEMARYTGAKKAVACVNGTCALHLALKMAGVKQGNEVITQSLTFIATANAIKYCEAEPIFLDVDMDTMGLSPKALQNFLETKTYFDKIFNKCVNKSTHKTISACVPMHTFGHPCRIDEIAEICNQYQIQVVEDAAESLGSFYKGQHTGTFGKIGVLSFNGNKIITTGGGGMLLFHDEYLAKRAKHLTTQAKLPHPWEFVHDEIGYNYRMPNINAALGLAQLEQLNKFLESKRNLAKEYADFFDKTTITYFKEPKDSISNYWLNCIFLKDKPKRDTFLKYTNENGVMTRPAWQLMNTLPMFEHCQTDNLETSNNISERLVNIPSSFIINK